MRPTLTIEDLFATPARMRMLRGLARTYEPLSIRQLARRVGLSHTAAAKVLGDLEGMALVRSSSTGRSITHWLVRENVYVQCMLLPTFDAETRVADELTNDLVEAFGDDSVSLILFGSYALDDQDQDSDIDVLAVSADELHAQRLREAGDERDRFFRDKYGSPLDLFVYTLAEARKVRASRKGFMPELDTYGTILHGLGTSEWGMDESETQDADGVSGGVPSAPTQG